MNEILQKLAQPFDPSDIDFKVQTKSRDRTSGLVVAYADARTYIERLNEVLGVNWSDSYRLVDKATVQDSVEYSVECTLTLNIDGDWVARSDVGTGDSLKGAYSDAFKRACVKFGLGQFLYSLPRIWATLNPDGFIADVESVRRRMLGGEAEDTRSSTPMPRATEPAPAPAPARSGERRILNPGEPATDAQIGLIRSLLKSLAKKQGEALDDEFASTVFSMALETFESITLNDLNKGQASQVIEWLKQEMERE